MNIINKNNMERKYFKAVVPSLMMNCLKTVCCKKGKNIFRRSIRRRVSRRTEILIQLLLIILSLQVM
jgi:hypothetical protein